MVWCLTWATLRPILLRFVREAALILTLMFVYDTARLLRAKSPTGAFEHAYGVLHIERALHFPREQSLQSLVLPIEPLVRAANSYYAWVNFPLTGFVLIWLVIFRPEHYLRVRTALVAATAVALAVYLLIPVAPPRMLSGLGFVDTGTLLGQSVYSSPDGAQITNQFAAMPSLHVGWAVLVAIACIAAAKNRWRWLWLAHPIVTFAVVVATANHYYLDGLVGTALVIVAYAVCKPLAMREPITENLSRDKHIEPSAAAAVYPDAP